MGKCLRCQKPQKTTVSFCKSCIDKDLKERNEKRKKQGKSVYK
jgi:hypothetical protein